MGKSADDTTHISMPLMEDANYQETRGRNEESEREGVLLKRLSAPESFSDSPQIYQILYRFERSDRILLRPPTWARESSSEGTRYTLTGEFLSMKAEEYLKRSRNIAFVIYKTYSVQVDAPIMEEAEKGQQAARDTRALPDPVSESISFISKSMIQAVQQYLSKQPDAKSVSQIVDINREIPAPYLFWYHFRPSFRNTLNELSSQHRELLELLADWMDANYDNKYTHADAQISRGVISRESMKYLVRPGDVLIAEQEGHLQAYLATSWAEEIPTIRSYYTGVDDSSLYLWQVSCWSYWWNSSLQRKKTTLEFRLDVKSSTEEVELQRLTVIPMRCASPEVQEKLEQRGKTYWKCREKRFVSCSGCDVDSLSNNMERFMIDFPTYKLLHQHESARYGAEINAIPPERMKIDEPPSVPELYVFPSTIIGYSLHSKKWVNLEVDKIQEVDWNKRAFESLVVSEETKELIQALVISRLEVEKGTDMIENKGNGSIILLHGGPGTGKTLTAESVAELAEKPLYRVTGGDIGTKPDVVEQYLESVLQLGKIWDCVVLLDEADVFLQERALSDLQRNVLVTVLLRLLENYNGILILTSNRVGTFDEAFKSRIQLALHYPTLTRPQRHKLWRNFITRLKELDQADIDFDDVECYLPELSEINMSGRQIRNAITTARQLAKFRGRMMTHAELKHVINVAGKFDTYWSDLKEGLTDDDIARAEGLR
ncbi:P-loop containing nucleoside triphosphate hydrolase protein [Aspergillus varians]